MPTHPNSRVQWYVTNVTGVVIVAAVLAVLAVQATANAPVVNWSELSLAHLQYAAIAPAFILLGFVAMFWVARRSVLAASSRSEIRARSTQKVPGLQPLPDSLRIISAPGLQYSVEVISGLALDKTANTSARHHPPVTRSRGARADEAIQSSALNQHGHLWVRMPDRREASWTLHRGACDVRPGEIVSAITQRSTTGQVEFLLLYNHATGEIARFDDRLATLHRTRGGFAWPLAAFVGSLGFGVAFGLVRFADPHDAIHAGFVAQISAWLQAWKTAAIAATAIAWFVAQHSKVWLVRRRDSVFQKRYAPELSRHLEECTPALEQHFANLR